MQTKTLYEEEILKDIQGLPLPFQEKLAKIVHILKAEVVAPANLGMIRKEKRREEKRISPRI